MTGLLWKQNPDGDNEYYYTSYEGYFLEVRETEIGWNWSVSSSGHSKGRTWASGDTGSLELAFENVTARLSVLQVLAEIG